MINNMILDLGADNRDGQPSGLYHWKGQGRNRNRRGGGSGGSGGGSGGGRSSGSGSGSSRSGNTSGQVISGGDYNYRNQKVVNFKPLQNLPSLNPDINRLVDTYGDVSAAYDPTAYLNSVNQLGEMNLATGLQSANSAAAAAANNAAQQGGLASSSVLRAQLLMPFLQQNAALQTQGQEFAAESKRGGVSAAANIASSIAGLRSNYINTLANYNAQNASNRLATQQLNSNIRGANNTGRFNEASFAEGQRQFDNNYNLQRNQFQESRRQFNTSADMERERLELAQRAAGYYPQTSGGGRVMAGGGARAMTGAGQPNVGLYDTSMWQGTAATNNAYQNDQLRLQFPNANFYPLAYGRTY